MKVTQNSTTNPNQIEQTKGLDRSKTIGKGAKAEDLQSLGHTPAAVEISDQAKWMRQAADIAHRTPEVRADRVADLKNKIKSGNYHVDNKAIAEKLVDEHIHSDFGKNHL